MEIASYKKHKKLFYKTPHLTEFQTKKEVFHINAEGKVFGSLLSKLAVLLQNKQSKTFSFHTPVKPKIILHGLDKIVLTGKKEETKTWFKHSKWTGNYREMPFDREKKIVLENLFFRSLRNMLPRTPFFRSKKNNVEFTYDN